MRQFQQSIKMRVLCTSWKILPQVINGETAFQINFFHAEKYAPSTCEVLRKHGWLSRLTTKNEAAKAI